MINRITLLLFIGLAWGQDYYGIFGYRDYKLEKGCTTCDIFPYYDDNSLALAKVNPHEFTIILGMGYKKYKPLKSFQSFSKYFINYEYDGMGFDYIDSYDTTDDYWNWGHFSIGAGYGIILKHGITLNTNIEYNIATGVDDNSDYEYLDLVIPDYNYISFNISIGLSKVNKGIWKTPLGIHYSKPIGKYYINPNFSQINANEFIFEVPATWFAGGLIIVGAAMVMAESIDSDLPSSSSLGSGSKGCHVYGKIKFVEFGEDYKVKFVSFGEDLKIKYVSFGADSPGEWKSVEFGEDYKIKVVEFGEDYKVKEVSFGEGCN
jgi:hypothetical protein